jgi:hypothetical protein
MAIAVFSSTLTDVSTETAIVHTAEKRNLPIPRATSIPMRREDNPTYDGVMSIDPEPQAIDPPRPTLPHRSYTESAVSPTLDFDFGSKFGKGHMGIDTDDGRSVNEADMDMKSALDRLMDDVAGPRSSAAKRASLRPLCTPDDSMVTEGSSGTYHGPPTPEAHPASFIVDSIRFKPSIWRRLWSFVFSSVFIFVASIAAIIFIIVFPMLCVTSVNK